ncbi:hypothetical protein QL285_034121 [Trifolium repens]|nr:hypothetical protein QL285_034121 [Trifolium repens]
MTEPDIIVIANNKERLIRDYAVFDSSSMNSGIIRPEISAPQFEFKPMISKCYKLWDNLVVLKQRIHTCTLDNLWRWQATSRILELLKKLSDSDYSHTH